MSLLSSTPPASLGLHLGAASTPASSHPPMSDTDPAGDLGGLRQRTTALESERDHYRQLSQRAADAFEEHRRDLTQLAQKERAIRAHREDSLREQLQTTLKENRELMARVAEQRRRHDEEWTARLQEQRESAAARQAGLEALLAELHSERAELQRSVAAVERRQDRYTRDITACVEDEERLRDRVRLVREGLRAAEEEQEEQAAAWARPHSSGGGDGEGGRRPPLRCVSRRRFVPPGPWDVCGPSRASSPTSHHIDALLSGIQRANYLRPRLYLQRQGRETSPLLPTAATCHSYGGCIGAADGAGASARRQSARTDDVLAPRRNPRHLDRPRRSRSPGLSASTASTSANMSASRDTSTPASSSHSCASSCSSPATSASRSNDAAEPRRHPCVRDTHQRARPPPSSPPAHRGVASAATLAAPLLLRSPARAASPFAAPTRSGEAYYGAATNSLCHALISDVAALRAEYHRCQAQLRDPRGDTVAASQGMRRLMRQMDDKVRQIRALRREQQSHQEALRVQEVLQQVVAENRYCEAVYKDLKDLIRA